MEEIEMQQRQIEEDDRGKITNVLVPSVKIVRSPVGNLSRCARPQSFALIMDQREKERVLTG